jgi:hypothetical protein
MYYVITFQKTVIGVRTSNDTKFIVSTNPMNNSKFRKEYLIFNEPITCEFPPLPVNHLACPSASSLKDYYYYYYGSIAICWALAAFSVSWSYTQSVWLLGREISPSLGHYVYTGKHKQRINARKHPCLEWDSNPRSQCLSERRQFTPQWSAALIFS